MTKDKTFNWVTLFQIVFLVLSATFGWVNNVVILATAVDTLSIGEVIVRLVGIFVVPLGVLMGYL